MARDRSALEIENANLRAANQILRDALAFTGHEWRNRIASLRMESEKLVRSHDVLPLDLMSAVERINQGTAQMAHIAQTYLGLARVETPVLNLERSLLNPIDDVIQPAVSRHAEMLTSRKQICEVRRDRPGLLTWADRNLLTTAFDNLIGNAVKYGKHGGAIIISVLERGNEDEFSVWNSGDGIGLDRLDSLFTRFSPGCGEGAEHTGIGLYLTRRIIESHGGRIWADSQPGAWVRVSFTLPKHAFRRRYSNVPDSRS